MNPGPRRPRQVRQEKVVWGGSSPEKAPEDKGWVGGEGASRKASPKPILTIAVFLLIQAAIFMMWHMYRSSKRAEGPFPPAAAVIAPEAAPVPSWSLVERPYFKSVEKLRAAGTRSPVRRKSVTPQGGGCPMRNCE